jgi:hypothetical protein
MALELGENSAWFLRPMSLLSIGNGYQAEFSGMRGDKTCSIPNSALESKTQKCSLGSQ